MIFIEDASSTDIEFLAAVCRDAKLFYDPIMEGSFERQARRYEEEGLPSNYNIRIIYLESKRIGFEAIKVLCENVVYIVGFYFLAMYQRNGHGSYALDIIKAEGREKGTKKLILLVHNKAEWAINFYQKNGFEIVAESRDQAISYQKEITDYYINGTYLMSYDL